METANKNETKIIDMTLIISSIICLCPMIYGIIMWDKLPEIMPIHFNINGNPDNWGSRWVNVFLLPIVLAVLNFIMHISFNLKAKKLGENTQTKLPFIFKWFTPIIGLSVNFVFYSYSLGFVFNISRVMLITLSMLFIIIGNYFPKAEKWIFNIPIKDEKLTKVKRTLGWSFVIAGLAGLALAFTPFGLIVFMGIVLVLATVVLVATFRANA